MIGWQRGHIVLKCQKFSFKANAEITKLMVSLAWKEQQQQQPFHGRLSGTTRVGRYQKKHSPTHTHPGQRTSFITFLYLQWSMASSLFSLHAWQSSRTTSFQVLFGLPLGLEPSTSYSMHFFTQTSSFRSTCPYHDTRRGKNVIINSVLERCVYLHLLSCWSTTEFTVVNGSCCTPVF